MRATISEQCGVKYVRLEGGVALTDAPGFADFLDLALADGNRNLIWDLGSMDPALDQGGCAVLVEGFARLRAEDSHVILLHPPERLLGMLRQIGVGRIVSVADGERAAMVHLFKNIEKKYDDQFFQLLMNEGVVTRQQLEAAFEEYGRRGKTMPIDEVMLEMGLLTIEDILRVLARRKTYLGEILVDARVISQGTLDQILDTQRHKGGKLGDLLKEFGAVSDREIYEALAIQYRRKTELAQESESEITAQDLINFLASDDYLIVKDSEERLCRLGESVVPLLVEQLGRRDVAFRASVARILGAIGDGRGAEPLAAALEDEDPLVRDEAYWALVKLTGQELPIAKVGSWRRWVRWHGSSLPRGPKALPEAERMGFETIVAEVLENRRPAVGFSMEYEAGKLNWAGGKITLLIRGDGHLLLKRNTRGEISLESQTLSAARVKELLETLYASKAWNFKTSRTYGDLNEPRHVLTLRYAPAQRHSIFYWATEMYGNLALMKVEGAVKDLLRFLQM